MLEDHTAIPLAAQIITDKYQDHLPHYRQSQRFRRRHEADIGRQPLNTWTHATARHLGPIHLATLPVFLSIQRIYQIETQTRQTAAPPACRELIRRARSLPIADQLHRFILEQYQIQRPVGNVGQALGYTLNQWEKIRLRLTQGVMEIDTNLTAQKDLQHFLTAAELRWTQMNYTDKD